METNLQVIKYCKCCKYRQSTIDSRDYVCSLTNKPPAFEETCSTYWEDPKLVKSQKVAEINQKAAVIGKKRFMYFSGMLIGINILVIILGMLTFYNYQNLGHIKAIVRLVVELIMLFGIYNGNSITKHVFTALSALGVILSFSYTFAFIQVSWAGMIFIPLIVFYLYAIYLLNIDRYFYAYFKSQQL
jgi:hypothetical protein